MSKPTGARKNRDLDLEAPFADGELGNVQKFLFAEPINRLMDEIQRVNEQLLSLERTVSRDIRQLNDRCDQETASRERVLDELAKQSEAGNADLSAMMNEYRRQSEKADATLQQALNTAVNQLDNSLSETRDSLEHKLAAATAKLATQKVDRKALSGLLGGIAMQIESEEADLDEAQSA